MIFIPYYTGSVINSIAIERSTPKATIAIVFVGLLSLGRWVPLKQINLNFLHLWSEYYPPIAMWNKCVDLVSKFKSWLPGTKYVRARTYTLDHRETSRFSNVHKLKLATKLFGLKE